MAMTTDELISTLTELAHCDIDAVKAYEQALSGVEDDQTFATLSQLKSEHVHHIDEYAQALKKLGVNPPENRADFKGFLLQGFTAIRSLTGTVGALNAMESNEYLINKLYEQALKKDLPEDFSTLVKKNAAEAKTHLQTIQHCLSHMD